MNDEMTGLMVGDIVRDLECNPPYLDEVGDVGYISFNGRRIARFVTVEVFRDPVTNEVRSKNVQIVEALEAVVKENPGAECHVHNKRFPCDDCKELERLNYASLR